MLADIIGKITLEATIKGTLTTDSSVVGVISVPLATNYVGEYRVVPKPGEEQILQTKNKVLRENLTVTEIPYYDVSNEFGNTIYIGKEIILNGN